jgi:putative S-adenosyl-L-methionine-dependent methyltransferase
MSRERPATTTMGEVSAEDRERGRGVVIQLRCIGKAQPSDLQTVLPALAEAAQTVNLDHARLAAVLDWVQYRRNFRPPVLVRPFAPPGTLPSGDGPLAEIAIDVRRAKDIPYDALLRDIVERLSKALGLMPDVHECIHLEDWIRPSKSVMWSFNRSYWRHLRAWDATFEKDYAAALPGGVSDGTNPDFWGNRIEQFIETLDRLDQWSELPDDIHVAEFGVGDGQQAKVWLDSFTVACAKRGRDYAERVRYLMADYSPHVLAIACDRLVDYADRVEAVEVDFRNPIHDLQHLRGKVLFAHTCNLYDNLPTDELMRVGDHAFEPFVRASITPREVEQLSRKHGIAQDVLVPTIQRVLRQGPQVLGDLERGVRFWSDVWDAIHLEEIYVEIPTPQAMRVAPSTDLHLDELLDELPEWTRVHASTVAVESFAQTLALLHHEGVLVAQDLFVRETGQYAAYRGPGKLEGSIVNWLNGPVFQLVGERAGFRVTVEPFTHRTGSNTVVLTARPRDANSRPLERPLAGLTAMAA